MGNFFYAIMLRVFGPGFEVFAKELGLGENVKLKSLVPAYYPIWRVDAIAEGPVSPMRGGKETLAWFSAKEAYIPGKQY